MKTTKLSYNLKNKAKQNKTKAQQTYWMGSIKEEI